jgi:hypothetical protein
VDLALHLKVLWRHRWLMLAGLFIALALAILSWVRVNPLGDPVVSYRQEERWSSTSRLFVTRMGFPWGRVSTDELSGTDAARLASLAVLYAELARGDEVQGRLLEPDDPSTVDVTAVPGPQFSGSTLPIIEIRATAPTQHQAVSLAREGAESLTEYIREQQDDAGIAPDDRVVVETLAQPSRPELVQPRKKTLPALVFVTVLVIVVALILLIENVKPSRPAGAEPLEATEGLQPVEPLGLRPPDAGAARHTS